ncbi:MAG: YdaU family protein [Paracoccaceae bacterium]
MRLPYMQFYVWDYEADTAHLTTEEDGALNRLLRLQWRTPGCTLPDDANWLRRHTRVAEEEWKRAYAPVLDEFFARENGRRLSRRLFRDYHRARDQYEKKSAAGRKSGEVRKALKSRQDGPSTARTDEQQPEPAPEPNPDPEEERDLTLSLSAASRLTSDWELPTAWLDWAIGEGMSVEAVRREEARFRDHWLSLPGSRGQSADWFATWRNWCRRTRDRFATNKEARDDGRLRRILDRTDRRAVGR